MCGKHLHQRDISEPMLHFVKFCLFFLYVYCISPSFVCDYFIFHSIQMFISFTAVWMKIVMLWKCSFILLYISVLEAIRKQWWTYVHVDRKQKMHSNESVWCIVQLFHTPNPVLYIRRLHLNLSTCKYDARIREYIQKKSNAICLVYRHKPSPIYPVFDRCESSHPEGKYVKTNTTGKYARVLIIFI